MEKRKENFSIGVYGENENDIVFMLKEADNIICTEERKISFTKRNCRRKYDQQRRYAGISQGE
ncbi:hypothetical protein [[Ruminococcus] lactaris]|uniref:hypothetical protein n=1 Tax=[Ruminococcus] lactaris TaxID=46228 RepID=UPI0024316A41|nr:hypothetical protein [[Ruminococcus] lactaris]